MYKVEAIGNHGSVDMESLDVNMELEPSGKGQGRVDETTDLLKQDGFYTHSNKKDGYEYQDEWLASSTDMGDLSTLVPSIHAYATGAIGSSHGKDYYIEDAYNACVNAAKFEIGLIRKLLENDAKSAKEIMAKFKPVFNSVDEYLAHKSSINMEKDTVKFNEDGTVTIDYKG